MNDIIDSIARVCHEANRAFCASLGDHSQPDWFSAPQWQIDSARAGVRFHLDARAGGRKVPPSASHDSWLAEKARDGWTYGPVKDAETRQHPCFVPYEQLPPEQKRKDYLFGAIIEALAQDIAA